MTRLWKFLPHGLVVAALVLFAAPSAWAQADGVIKVEVGKSTLLQDLARPEVIFIANPAIVDIVIERAGAMFLVGRQTGETNMRFLDGNGVPVLDVSIVVTPQEARHLTLSRGGGETTFSCNPRCSGVPNPHAAGANVAGQDTNLAQDKGKSGSSRRRGGGTGSARATPSLSPTVKGPGLVN